MLGGFVTKSIQSRFSDHVGLVPGSNKVQEMPNASDMMFRLILLGFVSGNVVGNGIHVAFLRTIYGILVPSTFHSRAIRIPSRFIPILKGFHKEQQPEAASPYGWVSEG
jgi:hypothetical protein